MTTLRDLLLPAAGRSAYLVDQAAAALVASRAVPDRADIASATVAGALLQQVGVELDAVQLRDVVVGAWKKGSALRRAARDTLRSPGTYRTVVLRKYQIPWEHELDVDVLVNGQKVSSVTFVASVDVDITTLSAIVRNGCVTSFAGGDGEVKAKLKATTARPVRVSVPLSQATYAFDLRIEIPLPGEGIRLAERA